MDTLGCDACRAYYHDLLSTEKRVDGALNPIIAFFAIYVAHVPTVQIVVLLGARFHTINPIIEWAAGNRITSIATVTITDLEILWSRR